MSSAGDNLQAYEAAARKSMYCASVAEQNWMT